MLLTSTEINNKGTRNGERREGEKKQTKRLSSHVLY